MAGSQNIGEASENPVGINVVPMVDVIFCLCLFFMCSLHFKQLEGKIETWLPKGEGNQDAPAAKLQLDEIRVRLAWDVESGRTVRKVGPRIVKSDLELVQAILAWPKVSALPVVVDADPVVPWREAVRVLDLCRLYKIDKVTFAEPWEPLAAH